MNEETFNFNATSSDKFPLRPNEAFHFSKMAEENQWKRNKRYVDVLEELYI